jgi:riboflavin synthase
MFSGLIEEIGRITRIERQGKEARIAIAAPCIAPALAVGESIAVDGACLTAERVGSGGFVAFTSEETLVRTTLGDARSGRSVNLERALRMGDRLGGHLVAGHVDATGTFIALEPRGEGFLLRVAAPAEILSLSVAKGSITVDGISLTLVSVGSSDFTVAVIPQTHRATTLHERRAGDPVNLESDMIGKYVAKNMGAWQDAAGDHGEANQRMLDLLRRSGFAQ